MLRRAIPFCASRNARFGLRHKSSGGRRPKKKTYHRVAELDRVMELRKKPLMILQLTSLVQSQPHRSPLFLRDLEKNVGFVRKWAFMALIEKHPSVFRVAGTPPSVSLTARARTLAQEEAHVRASMEPLLVTNLRKLLMLCVDCKLPLQTVELVGPQLGLPSDFKDCLIPKYPQFFRVRRSRGRDCLLLEDWDSTLAVTSRETSSGSRHQPQISRTAKLILTLLSIILACQFHTHFGGTHFVSHPLHVYLSLNVYLSIIHSFGCVSCHGAIKHGILIPLFRACFVREELIQETKEI
ncbi:protein ROOT PRIMORDIUM DEFECTIVE 1-like isoform X4 [Vigna radiata var. radiata]|uniref:Protein ROOT PRIMORDIUM DEFECTIVE 1-like isoform X4 n=1 Tax=Vigna radiata var. radiata TaxID=3916 RepID=A0A3Q0FCG6_VIGRR|nr:protein ROOT PRIMORDIUM DEFECTIVE 1-like isoform X4 [Vigna radiata var. radiata]XP_022640314.1 protein ROOT PRIMORDIUM DEFECTIVE 1-like isoform X4 [Vigna radiata var. radiata]